MRQDVWAVLKHMLQNDTETLEQQHDYCPKDGWCHFRKSRDNYDDEKDCQPCFMTDKRLN